MPILVNIFSVIGFLLGLGFFESGIRENSEVAIVLGSLFLLPSLVLFVIPFFLGITISKRRVTVFYYQEFKTFSYKDIKYIEISLDDDGIYGKIKAEGQRAYDFYLDEFSFEPFSHFRFLWTAKVKLSKRYIEKNVQKLKKCPKVEIIEQKK